MLRCVLLLAALLSTTILLAQGGHAESPESIAAPPANASKLNDAVTRMVRRLDAGQTTLTIDRERGYLPSLLRELHIPVSSQVLVFSKTSLQFRFITPQTPRAIYFNDDVYVGFVPDGELIEISAVDPDRGAIFYTQTQLPRARPRLVTNHDCLQCHATAATQGVAGHLLRSVFTRSDGQMDSRAQTFLTDHRSPFAERWGGWYVTGSLSGDTHMGNAFLRDGADPAEFDRTPGTALRNVAGRFHSERYLTGDSDVVALMVLDHQVRMHNLLARLHQEAGSARMGEALEELLRYTLFVDEATLKGPITGSTRFATEFEQRGPSDSNGRSLRQFDLHTRLFRYPCSYLIYSAAFLALPDPVKQQFYSRLGEILSGADASPAFARLQRTDRTAIAEILSATHTEFAAYQANHH
ncbi:MAG: hypothetical protein ABIW19_07185 [Vicinamibacterales bacterium]